MIIATIDELNEYIEAQSLTNFDTIKPSIRSAERRHLVPILGQEQYDQLLELYADQAGLSNDEQTLLDLCQESVANIALGYAISRLSVQISDAGVRRSESQDMKTAFQYQEKNAREAYAQAGFDVLEDLLQFLDDKRAVFTSWANSTAFGDYKKYFIPSGIEFSRFYQIKQSRLVYLTVSYIMRNVENFTLKDIVGKELFAALKTKQEDNSLPDNYAALLEDYIKPGIAMHTIAKGLMQRSLDLTPDGVSIALQSKTLSIDTKEQADLQKFQAAIAELNAEGDECFRRLANELDANGDQYPDYVAPDVPGSLMNITNAQDNSYYGV